MKLALGEAENLNNWAYNNLDDLGLLETIKMRDYTFLKLVNAM
jgi:hypothetical protein